jgi:hypothetical protein
VLTTNGSCCAERLLLVGLTGGREEECGGPFKSGEGAVAVLRAVHDCSWEGARALKVLALYKALLGHKRPITLIELQALLR